MTKANCIILHNIRSAHNVGSIFRTADASGINKIWLSGYTPTPLDRFGQKRKDLTKVSLGAENYLQWEHTKNINRLITNLRKQGFSIIAIEQSEDSIDYKKYKTDKPIAFIFGNEVRGLSKQILNQSDVIIEIPMYGKKESLNVAVTAGIILFNF